MCMVVNETRRGKQLGGNQVVAVFWYVWYTQPGVKAPAFHEQAPKTSRTVLGLSATSTHLMQQGTFTWYIWQCKPTPKSDPNFEYQKSPLWIHLSFNLSTKKTFKKYQAPSAPSAKHFPSTLALDPMAPDRGSFRCLVALVALVFVALDLGGRCFAVEGRRGTALQQVRPEGHPGHEAWQQKVKQRWYSRVMILFNIIHEIVIVKYVSQSVNFFCLN